jgi:endonuclease YncB( thermonuclease family)
VPVPAIATRLGVTVGVLAVTVALPLGVTTGSAAAVHATASPRSSAQQRLIYCYGTVGKVDDGDTVNVRLTSACPGGRKGDLMVVRNAGIQATEIAHAGTEAECWSHAGEDLFRSLMHHGQRVRLSSYFATPAPDRGEKGIPRWRKYVDAWIGGQWVDVQAAEILAGDAMFKQEPVETAHLAEYLRDEQKAMYDGRGMWGHPSHCSDKYDQGAQFESWIVWKTNGPDDAATAHEESFDVKNVGTTSVNLSHWAIRDGSHHFAGGTDSTVVGQRTYLVLPKGTVLAPGKTLVIHPSHGKSKPSKLIFYNNGHVFTGASRTYFPNATMGHGGLGAHPTSAYPGGSQLFLVDPALDFRAWSTYPCVYKCGTPAPLTIWANPGIDDHNTEYVTVTNPTQDTVDTTGDVVDMDGRTLNLKGDLAAGATITIHCQGTGRNTALNKYWDNLTNQLPNSGGTIWLRTARDVTIDTYSWGNSGIYNYFK